ECEASSSRTSRRARTARTGPTPAPAWSSSAPSMPRSPSRTAAIARRTAHAARPERADARWIMSRRMMGVIAAVVLGAIGTFVLVAYVRDAEDRAVAGERMVGVIVASANVDAGTAAEDLGTVTKPERVPQKVRSHGAITSLDEVKGL